MFHFLSGAIMFGFAVASAFFFKYWRRTRDGFFLIFGAAFVLLAGEQFVLELLGNPPEQQTFVYLIRLAAFVLILVAIAYKNRRRS